MPTYFQRPENALKRANEFVDVGKKERALGVLLDVLKNKNHRTWSKHHEQIMEKFLTHCVELKKSHIAKEGIYQYRIICQRVNPRSLEYVVKYYLQLAEEKTENARNKSHQMVVDSDDLDILQTPEKMLMSFVNGEDLQDRSDRAVLTPWVKFLWESYRLCLDLLRNNQNFERCYLNVAQNAFKFCLNYSRKTEFRKLCEILRSHLGQIDKNQNPQGPASLNNSDSQSLHLETRLAQLDSAIQIELWQEAFKAVEDIHSLIHLSKKHPKPSLMASYYQKLALVLYKSGNALYHACAWHKLYHLYRDQRKNMTESEMQNLASRVVVATLAIPLYKNPSDYITDVEETDKDKKLSNLLFYSVPATRNSLVKDLLKYDIVQHAYPELSDLQHLLEAEFQPLELPKKANIIFEFLATKDELAPYIQSLQDVTLTRFMKQISQVFQTISISHLQSMVPFADKFRLEKVIVTAAKNLNLQVRINHKDNHLSFGTDFDLSQENVLDDGLQLQSMPNDKVKNQLIVMARALEKCVAAIHPEAVRDAKDASRHQIWSACKATSEKEHLLKLKRQQIIEDRKQEIENSTVQKEREEQEVAKEQKRRHIQEEMARLNREKEEREKQMKIDEQREIQKKVVRERLEQVKSTSLGAKAFADLDEQALASLDIDDILAKQVEQFEKEKKEKEEKLLIQEKKVDYFERAKCIEEIPLLLKKHEEDTAVNKIHWEENEIEKIDKMKRERQLALVQKRRLQRMKVDTEDFAAKLYKEKLKKFEKNLEEEKEKRLLERREKRRTDRSNAWLREREEEVQRKKDEQLKKQQEESERLARAKKEQEDREYQEKKRKLEEIERKKREKELEVEKRERQRREESRPVRKEEPVKEDNWKRNEREKKDGREIRENMAYRDQTDKRGFKEEIDRRGFREEKENRVPREEQSIRYDREERSVRDNRAPREERDFRGPREERSFGVRNWQTQRNEKTVQGNDSWRRNDGPSKTEPCRKEAFDSWRSQKKDVAPAAKREDARIKNDTPARRDDAWNKNDGPARRDTAWTRNDAPAKREEASKKDDASARKENSWRSQRNPQALNSSEKKDEIKKMPKNEEDDGWQTVRR